MNSINMRVPSKTFLLGEYLALKGGPTLILTTNPSFSLIATRKTGQYIGIHPQSPAGKYINEYSAFFRDYEIRFMDPYNGVGGFGASTAQFLMVFALKQPTIHDEELMKEYIKFAWNGEGTAPSGADLIAQRHGSLCFFHKAEKNIQTYPWPFPDLEYCLVHTGNKLATHIHLQKLDEFNTTSLEEIVWNGLIALENRQSFDFMDAINRYRDGLASLGFVAESTQKILKELAEDQDILAAKGCGALGADVIFLLFKKEKREEVVSSMKRKNIHVIKYGNEVSRGLNISYHD